MCCSLLESEQGTSSLAQGSTAWVLPLDHGDGLELMFTQQDLESSHLGKHLLFGETVFFSPSSEH